MVNEKAVEAALAATDFATSRISRTWMLRALNAALPHLLPAPPSEGEAEPVVWMVTRPNRDGAWGLYLPLFHSRKEMEHYQRNNADEKLAPLFAAPPNAEKVQALVEAARATAKRLHEINDSPSTRAVYESAFIHGVVYDGPKYDEALVALDAALRAIGAP